MAQRGNVDYGQLRQTARKGQGSQVQMFGGGLTTTGHVAVYNAAGDLIDGGAGAGGAGTVTSVDLTMPPEFQVTGNPITAAGTLAVAKASQAPNLVWASPASGSGAPFFRALVAADIPGGGGGSQTPWLSNINGNGFQLFSATKIGIGAAAPAFPLDIIGANQQIRLANQLTGTPQVRIASGAGATGAPYMYFSTDDVPTKAGAIGLGVAGGALANDIVLATYASSVGWSERLRVLNSNGFTGIGVAAPSTPLDVRLNVEGAGVPILTLINNCSNAAGNSARLRLGPHSGFAGNPQLSPYVEAICETSGFCGLGFGTYNSSGVTAERMRINQAGFIGIGTNAPGNLLTVIPAGNPASPAAATQIGIGEASNNVAYRLNLGFYVQGGAIWTGCIQALANGVGTPLVLNPNGGFVSIGYAVPSATLHIVGPTPAAGFSVTSQSPIQGALLLDDSGATTGSGGMVVFGAGTSAWRFAAIKGYATNGTPNSTGDLVFYTRRVTTDAALSETMRVGALGTVGINTASIGDTLTVNGLLGTAACGQVRLTYGTGPGLIMRNDSAYFYLLVSANGDPYGGFSAARPFALSMAGDHVNINQLGIGTVFTPTATVVMQVRGSSLFESNVESYVNQPFSCNVYNSAGTTWNYRQPGAAIQMVAYDSAHLGPGNTAAAIWVAPVGAAGAAAPTRQMLGFSFYVGTGNPTPVVLSGYPTALWANFSGTDLTNLYSSVPPGYAWLQAQSDTQIRLWYKGADGNWRGITFSIT